MKIKWRAGLRHDEPLDAEASTSGDGHEWTGASALTTRAVTALLWVLLAAGPVALGLMLAHDDEPAPVRAMANGEIDLERQAAEAFAERAVVTWLTATRSETDRERISELFGIDPGTALPETVPSAQRPAVSSSEPAGDGAWSVTVAVDVTRPAADEDAEPAAGKRDSSPAPSTVRRHFQLPVVVDDGAVAAAAAPAPVPAPPEASSPSLTYATSVGQGSTVAEAVAEFLTGLLAGGGGLDRVVAPGVQIRPIDPAPYIQVDITAVVAVGEPPSMPSDGDRLQVLATARATHARGAAVVQYPLTLTARDGRWEIEAVDPVPVRGAPPESPDPAGSATPPPATADGPDSSAATP